MAQHGKSFKSSQKQFLLGFTPLWIYVKFAFGYNVQVTILLQSL